MKAASLSVEAAFEELRNRFKKNGRSSKKINPTIHIMINLISRLKYLHVYSTMSDNIQPYQVLNLVRQSTYLS